MVKVNFVRDDDIISVDVPVGYTIMEAAKELDLPEIPADCGGCCACATCHIYVDVLQWPQLKIKDNSLEQELLEYEKGYITDKSRLACQIQLNDELNNVTVKLRKDELL
ncbi:2Fe-2S iron-sulfur cluster-binding protein [bacterium]|nr:2Fe-2S iron-sulfur cluster-binding protein [bacterium]